MKVGVPEARAHPPPPHRGPCHESPDMTAKITWFEVLGRDAAALRAFYADLFGWTLKIQETPMGPYGVSDAAETGIPGGVGPAPRGSGWTTVYVDVDDLDAALARARAGGGTVLMPPTDLPEVRIAVIADPEGHPVGLSQSR